MERLDVLVAGLGVLVVAVALGGVVTAPPAAGAASFTVGFVADRADLPAQTGTVTGESTGRFTFDVPTLNITHIDFTITAGVTGAPPGTTVTVGVEGPQGQRGTANGAAPAGVPGSVTIPVPIEVASTPPPVTLQAADAAAAIAGANRTSMNGTGTWTVTVVVSSGLPASATQTNLNVAATIISFHAVIQPATANPR